MVRCCVAASLLWAGVLGCSGRTVEGSREGNGGSVAGSSGAGGTGGNSGTGGVDGSAGGADSRTGIEPEAAGGRPPMITASSGGAAQTESYDAGPPPPYCGERDIPNSTSLTPGPGDLPGEIIVKFMVGTHLHIVDGKLSIDESTLSSDRGFLRCTGLTLAGAKVALAAINDLVTSDPNGSIATLFAPNSGELNVYFILRITEARAPELLAVLRNSPLVNLAYYAPAPAPPP
jgi:hypothetical protein